MRKIGFICLLALILWACNEDDKIEQNYNGSDNYIITFDISKEGITWKAKIADQRITITAPYGQDLAGASAKVVLAENAVISPDPASITDWNEERNFTVTAYNGAERIYTYTLEYADKAPSGDVQLITQDEVDNFVHTGISVIDGNLIIGNNTEENSIENLSGLSNLEQITGMLQINSSYGGYNLSGLENLSILGSLKIGDILAGSGIPALTDLTLPSLKEITTGNIFLSLHTLKTFSLENLISVAGSIYINSTQLEEMNLPHLQKVAGEINLTNSKSLETLLFPELQNMGGNLFISDFDKLFTCDFPALETVKNISIGNCRLLQNIIFEKLPICNSLILGEMTSLVNLRFPSLQNIEGNFEINAQGNANMVFSDLSGLDKLAIINGVFTFSGFRAVTGINHLNNLRSVKGMTLNSLLGWTEELDLRTIEFNGATLTCTNCYIPVIKGPEVFNGSISFTRSSATNLSALEGFKIFNGNLELTNYNTRGFVLSIKDMEYIENINLVSCSYINSIDASNLKEIGGTLSINDGRMVVDFPELEKIGKQLSITGTVTNLQGFNFPRLKEIGDKSSAVGNCVEIIVSKFNIEFPSLEVINGSMNFTTGTAANTTITSLQCPALKTLSGNLSISASHANQTVSILNFDNLSVMDGNITINNLAALSDFSTFGKVIPVLNSNRWTITNCGYNPTWEQMNRGETNK